MITIYGASDDLVEVAGCEGADEFYVASVLLDGQVCWHGDLVAPGGTEQMRVSAFYDGCWHIALGQTDESVPMAAWGNGTGQAPDCDYSAMASIDAPEGTRLTNVWPEVKTGA
jgi:hypothetical protein